ncbi:hypothetical protein ACFQ0M_08950 [Kitasatospora aburaviensis]
MRLAAHLLGCRFVPLHAGDPADVAAARAVAAEQRPAVFVVDRRGAAALGAPEPGVLSSVCRASAPTCPPWRRGCRAGRCARAPGSRTSPWWRTPAAPPDRAAARSTGSPR